MFGLKELNNILKHNYARACQNNNINNNLKI